MYRKRIIRLLSIFLLFLLLSACGTKRRYSSLDTNHEKTNTAQNSSMAEAVRELLPKKLIKIGFVQVGHESDWRIAATKSCQEVFSEENGYELYFVDADNEPKAQVAAVRNFIKERVDYIIIDPILTTGWTAVLKEARHAGIPVFLIDRTIECDPRYYKAWFGSDFICEGECAGQWLQNYLYRNGRGMEPVKIVTINGTPGASAQLGRTEGFARYLERNENWQLLAQESGDFTESGGKQVMEAYLQQYPDLDVVICQNDNEALGACAAMDEAGIPYGKGGAAGEGERKNIIVISFDATRAGLEAVLNGKINADFECNPLASPYVADAVQQLEAGGTLPDKENYLPEDCFTYDERPMSLYMAAAEKQMVVVTRELIDSRVY